MGRRTQFLLCPLGTLEDDLPTHSGVNAKMLASLKQVKLYYLRNI